MSDAHAVTHPHPSSTTHTKREDKKRIHVTKEVYSMLSQTAAELNRAQKDFAKGKLVDR